VPLRGTGETPDEGFPTQKQSGGLFFLPFLRLPFRSALGALPQTPHTFEKA
jgi:hypothetical protein